MKNERLKVFLAIKPNGTSLELALWHRNSKIGSGKFFYGLDSKEAKEVSIFLVKNDFYFKHEENEDV